MAKVRIPDKPSHSVTSRDEPSQGVTLRTDKDMELDSELDSDLDSDYECESDSDNEFDGDRRLTSTSLMPSASSEKRHRDFEAIKVTAQAIDEATGGEYPYVARLVKKYYEINEENGWIGTDGKPIVDTIRWYKGFLDAELPNGYQVKDIAISEE